MPGTEFRITKKKTPVEIVCSDGAVLIGFLFIGQQARLSDTLNDGRQFLPFENGLGEVTMLRKDTILRTTPLGDACAAFTVGQARAILGLPPDAGADQAEAARATLTAAYGPGAVRELGLPEEYGDLARLYATRLDAAYDRIAGTRRTAETDARRYLPRGWTPRVKRIKTQEAAG